MRAKLSCLVLLIVMASAPAAWAQSARMEAGSMYAALSLTYPDQTRSGLEGWFAWDFSPAIGLDAALSLFPADDELTGRLRQGLAGVRSGFRADRVAVFGRLRPGVVHFSRQFLLPDTGCILIFPPPEGCLTANTNAAIDVGGTVALYPTDRTALRFDVGDTAIRFRREGQPTTWKHNLQVGFGAGVRF